MGRAEGGSAADITRHLKGMNFPAMKEDLIRHARQKGADQDVMDRLERLVDREYDSMADVIKEFGKAA